MKLPLTYHPKSPSPNIGGYRYFFNGQEADNEMFGEVANFGYEFRQYDSRLGKWWGVDPKWNEYPSMSSYTFCANNPINLKDPNGMNYNPVFSTEGVFLGTDKNGFEGIPIVMEKCKFHQGMDRNAEEGKEIGVPLNKYGMGISISESEWQKVVSNNGERLNPTVTNSSDFTIYYKPEGMKNNEDMNPGYLDNKAYPIPAHTDLYASVDGVAAPHINKRMVFKITDGIQISVSNKKVKITNSASLKNRVGMFLIGGWKGEEWHSSITSDKILISNRNDQPSYYMYFNPDYGWDELFKISR